MRPVACRLNSMTYFMGRSGFLPPVWRNSARRVEIGLHSTLCLAATKQSPSGQHRAISKPPGLGCSAGNKKVRKELIGRLWLAEVVAGKQADPKTSTLVISVRILLQPPSTSQLASEST